jgi:hypothetical protein
MDMLALAKERMAKILETHRPKPLTAEQEQALEDILREARTYYRQKGLLSDDEWRTYSPLLNGPG